MFENMLANVLAIVLPLLLMIGVGVHCALKERRRKAKALASRVLPGTHRSTGGLGYGRSGFGSPNQNSHHGFYDYAHSGYDAGSGGGCAGGNDSGNDNSSSSSTSGCD